MEHSEQSSRGCEIVCGRPCALLYGRKKNNRLCEGTNVYVGCIRVQGYSHMYQGMLYGGITHDVFASNRGCRAQCFKVYVTCIPPLYIWQTQRSGPYIYHAYITCINSRAERVCTFNSRNTMLEPEKAPTKAPETSPRALGNILEV